MLFEQQLVSSSITIHAAYVFLVYPLLSCKSEYKQVHSPSTASTAKWTRENEC